MTLLYTSPRRTGGLFGRRPTYDMVAAPAEPMMAMGATPAAPATGAGMFAAPMLAGSAVTPADMDFSATAASTQDGMANARGPGFFDRGGLGLKILAGIGDFGTNMAASQGDPAAMARLQNESLMQRQRAAWGREDAQRMQARDWAVEDRDARMNAPDFFMSGRDRVRYDPRTGQSSVVYQGMDDSESYAAGLGYERGTPEYQTAMQDYVLRGNGPTAYGYDVGLEEARQTGRENMEGMRQRNRISLRGMPTYRDTHPRPSGGGGGGGGGRAPRVPTMAGTMAPILGKVAAGQTLTPGEQQAWSMYRSGRTRGGSGGGAGGGVPQVRSAADYNKLASGTQYRDPSGNLKVKR